MYFHQYCNSCGFWRNLHRWQRFYTAAGSDSIDKFHLCHLHGQHHCHHSYQQRNIISADSFFLKKIHGETCLCLSSGISLSYFSGAKVSNPHPYHPTCIHATDRLHPIRQTDADLLLPLIMIEIFLRTAPRYFVEP